MASTEHEIPSMGPFLRVWHYATALVTCPWSQICWSAFLPRCICWPPVAFAPWQQYNSSLWETWFWQLECGSGHKQESTHTERVWKVDRCLSTQPKQMSENPEELGGELGRKHDSNSRTFQPWLQALTCYFFSYFATDHMVKLCHLEDLSLYNQLGAESVLSDLKLPKLQKDDKAKYK